MMQLSSWHASTCAQGLHANSVDLGRWMGNRTDLNGDELNERLWLACVLGDDEVVLQAVKDGAQVCQSLQDSRLPCICSLLCLRDASMQVDALDLVGWGAMHYCAWSNHPSTLQADLPELPTLTFCHRPTLHFASFGCPMVLFLCLRLHCH